MSTRIMDLSKLQVGNTYRLITNAGHFDKLFTFRGNNYEFAVFVDKDGNRELVHTSFLWRDSNPIIIKLE